MNASKSHKHLSIPESEQGGAPNEGLSRGDQGSLAVSERLRLLAWECHRLGFKEQAERVEQAARDCDEPLLVMVVGEGNVGKSSLVNALLGREVAPISRLPKTWKVDLYQSLQGEQEHVFASWRHKPDLPDRLLVEEARALSEREEAQAELKEGAGGSWRSELFQMRWCVRTEWPPPQVVLVDTPGFAQLRSDTSVEAVSLYGAEGFEVEVAEDAFQYWYRRADVVLWCLKATRLEDRDALEALKATAALKKPILGVLTHMDRIPLERWDEIKDAARRLFGRWISGFHCMAGGRKNPELAAETVARLRGILNRDIVVEAAKLKAEARRRSYEAELGVFRESLDAISKAWLANLMMDKKVRGKVTRELEAWSKGLKRNIGVALTKAKKTVEGRLPLFWSRSGGDADRFSELLREEGLSKSGVGEDVGKLIEASTAGLVNKLTAATRGCEWEGVALGGGVEPARRLSREISVTFGEIETVISDVNINLTGEEGDGGALTVGAVAAGIGFMLLGPIGLAAGALGAFAKSSFQQEESEKKARRAIARWSRENRKRLESMVERVVIREHRDLDAQIRQSFVRHHGGGPEEAVSRLGSLDHALGKLNEPGGVALRGVASWLEGVGLGGLEWGWYLPQLVREDEALRALWSQELKAQWANKVQNAFDSVLETTLPPAHGGVGSLGRRAAVGRIQADLSGWLWENSLWKAKTFSGLSMATITPSTLETQLNWERPPRSYLPNAEAILAEVYLPWVEELHAKLGEGDLREAFRRDYEDAIRGLGWGVLHRSPEEDLEVGFRLRTRSSWSGGELLWLVFRCVLGVGAFSLALQTRSDAYLLGALLLSGVLLTIGRTSIFRLWQPPVAKLNPRLGEECTRLVREVRVNDALGSLFREPIADWVQKRRSRG